MKQLLSIQPNEWKKKSKAKPNFSRKLGRDMPAELIAQREELTKRFGNRGRSARQ